MGSPVTNIAATSSASDSNLRRRKEELVRLQRPWRLRSSASDSNLRRRKKKWFRLLRRRRLRGPRLILFFVPAKEMVPPADRHDPTVASILDFRLRLENQCRDFPVYALLRASILDFRLRLGNRCKDFPVYPLLRASILDFRPELANRCKVFPVYGHSRASILDFRGSIWESLHGFARKRPPACSDS